jgi:hypothetical protein
LTKHTGFRDLQMDGVFDFSINGKKVKLWGANLVPLKGLSHRWNAARMSRLLDMAEHAHMVSLRAWGPGAPFHDMLYDEADRRGILMWHEFFHTWGTVPYTESFRNQCREEAEHYVTRLKHHPSIILWCGGNETHMGSTIRGNYDEAYLGKDLFERDYRAVCQRLDPGRYYHPSSPSGGAYPNDPSQGDSHSYTHNWVVPGEQYPVLFTENTRVSPPPVHSLKVFLQGEELWPAGFTGMIKSRRDAPMPASWMKLTLGNDYWYGRPGPIEDFFDTGDTPEGLIYRMNAAYCLYIRRYVERYRTGRPARADYHKRKTMGHYIWKLNSTWPEIYGEMIDYLLEPKMCYYALRRAYAPVLLSFEFSDGIFLWGVNDTPRDIEGRVRLRYFGILHNRLSREVERDVSLPAGESRVLLNLEEFGMFPIQDALYAELFDKANHCVARATDFADKERHLEFPRAELGLTLEKGLLKVTTDAFARCVELTGDEGGDAFGWFFEDNYFDLFPFEEKTVKIMGRHSCGTITASSRHSPAVAVGI